MPHVEKEVTRHEIDPLLKIAYLILVDKALFLERYRPPGRYGGFLLSCKNKD